FGGRAALRYGAAVLGAGLVLSGLFLALTDRDAMLFNAFTWPGHLPWKGSTPGNLGDALVELLPYALPWAIVLLAGGRREGRAWSLPVLVGLALVPLSVLGRVKKGGDLNSFSPTLYPLLLACAARLVRLASSDGPVGAIWRRLIAAALAGLTVLGVPQALKEVKLYGTLRPARAEYDFLRAHPGVVFFPWHPLAHLAAEGRPTHHLHSAHERGVAGFLVENRHLTKYIPENCRYVCFPLKRFGPVVGFGWSFELLEAHGLLERGARPVSIAELPDYECYVLKR
ncbi:MAG: hypothetical protein IRY99_24010, partial [Isosphaeraceae bacterium]|nr:hypothetical protein [Isosphaeraceae bacterium]